MTTGEEESFSSADNTSDDKEDVAVHCDEVLLDFVVDQLLKIIKSRIWSTFSCEMVGTNLMN